MPSSRFNPIQIIRQLVLLDSSPRKIAGSMALGAFIGSIPLVGVQNLTALLLSFLLRVNRVGTVLSLELYCNLITLPFVCYLDFKIGCFLLRQRGPVLGPAFFKGLSWEKIQKIAAPLFLGGVVLGCLIAPFAYGAALALINAYRKRNAPAPLAPKNNPGQVH